MTNEQLLSEIEQAKRYAISVEVLQRHEACEKEFLQHFPTHFSPQCRYMERLVNRSRMFCESLEALERALFLLDLPTETIIKAVQHEKAHYNAAQSLGLRMRLGITFYLNAAGQLMAVPFCQTKCNCESSPINDLQLVIEAPGIDMSSCDQRTAKLLKQLRQFNS